MPVKRVLMPLPRVGFDPSEAAAPWKVLTDADVEVVTHTNAAGRPHCVSARWPGDAFTFARRFLGLR